MPSPLQPVANGSNRVRIVVATSVMLTFISYWRAAAIVLNDLASSAFYACGIAEQAVGKSAPWFIVGVMLFSFTVRAVYVESCSMFVRGGGSYCAGDAGVHIVLIFSNTGINYQLYRGATAVGSPVPGSNAGLDL